MLSVLTSTMCSINCFKTSASRHDVAVSALRQKQTEIVKDGKNAGMNDIKAFFAFVHFEFCLIQMACSNIRYGAGCTREVGLVSWISSVLLFWLLACENLSRLRAYIGVIGSFAVLFGPLPEYTIFPGKTPIRLHWIVGWAEPSINIAVHPKHNTIHTCDKKGMRNENVTQAQNASQGVLKFEILRAAA